MNFLPTKKKPGCAGLKDLLSPPQADFLEVAREFIPAPWARIPITSSKKAYLLSRINSYRNCPVTSRYCSGKLGGRGRNGFDSSTALVLVSTSALLPS